MKNTEYGIDKIIDLLKNNINVNIQDKNGKTALMYACKFSNYDDYYYINHLLEKGANISIKDEKGNTAIDYTKSYNNKLRDYLSQHLSA